MTLRGTEAKPVLPEAVVLSEARRGKLAFVVDAGEVIDAQHREARI